MHVSCVDWFDESGVSFHEGRRRTPKGATAISMMVTPRAHQFGPITPTGEHSRGRFCPCKVPGFSRGIRNDRGRIVLTLIGAVVGWLQVGVAIGQNDDQDALQVQPPNVGFQVLVDPFEPEVVDFAGGLQPAHDRDAESWLRRAAEAAEREDWKLVSDTLERIIRDHGSTLIRASDGSYHSAIEMAQAQIAALPADGLEAYRILFDPTAKRLLDQARENHEMNRLREVARVYPMTTHGPEALDLLTVWLLDSMQPGEALAFLNRLETLDQSRVPIREIALRRAAAYALLGRSDRAKRTIDAMDDSPEADAEFDARVASLSAFLESDEANGMIRSHRARTWSSRMGPTSVGLAEPLEPLISVSSGSMAILPSKDKADPKAYRRVVRAQGRPPVWQIVTDAERVFVTCPAGLIALDPATFEILWQALPPTRPINRPVLDHRLLVGGFGSRRAPFEDTDLLDDYSTMSLYLEYRGAVSTANGLVFVIGQDKGLNERNPSKDGIPVGQPTFDSSIIGSGNAIFAYQADSGLLAWVRGRGGPRDHRLTDVHFYCTPIAYGDNMLVTYVRNGDLYLGELSTDGDLVKEVAIGSGRVNFFPMYALLEPTIANGSVFVPSGAGLLTALYEHDLSLRWLAHYDRIGSLSSAGYDRPGALFNYPAMTPRDEWLSTPPIQAGTCVLLATSDSDKLLAFDTESGTLRWSAARGDDRYIVGATDDVVVLAGKSIRALRVEDGEPIWAHGDGTRFRSDSDESELSGVDSLHVSGRPLLFEDRVLVPTFNGIAALDLATGEPFDDMLGSGIAFGNLGAFDGSLYSVGQTTISKYPDPLRAQQLALARLQRNPNDVQALQRLAWLASLRLDWTTALDWLARADGAIESLSGDLSSDADVDRARLAEDSNRVSHYRVGVLLKMAEAGDDEARSARLKEAVAAARLPTDRTAAGLALATHDFATGHEADAGDMCVNLLVQSRGRPIRVDDNWRIQDALEIGRRLRQFYNQSSEAGQASIESALSAATSKLDTGRDLASLVRISDALAFMPLGASLDLKIADRELAEGMIESAVHHLNRAIQRTRNPESRMVAMVRLASICADPPEFVSQDVDMARRLLDLLTDMDPQTPIGGDFHPRERGEPIETIGQFIAWCDSRLASRSSDRIPAILRDARQLALIAESYVVPDVGETSADHNVSSFWDSTTNTAATSTVIPAFMSNQFRGIRADADDAQIHRWIHDPNFVVEWDSSDAAAKGPRAMAVDGRVAILVGPGQVEAIGLETGRVMWTPIPLIRHLGPLPNPPVVSHAGVAIVATDPNTIVAAGARDGAEPLWRRTFPDRAIGTMRISDGRLICVDESAVRASVLEIDTGLLLREYQIPMDGRSADEGDNDDAELFGDMRVESTDVRLAFCGSYILRMQDSKVIARRAATGEVAWDLALGDPVVGIDSLDASHAVIYHGKKSVKVVNPVNGHELLSFNADGIRIPPIDAVVDRVGGESTRRLLLFSKLDDLKSEFVLRSYPFDDGAEPWSHELGDLANISPQMLRALPDAVAVVTNDASDTSELDAMGEKRLVIDVKTAPMLYFIGKRNGRRIGPSPYHFYEGRLGANAEPYEDPRTQTRVPPFNVSRAIRDVIVTEDRIIAFAPEGYYVLADKKAVRAAKGQAHAK